jgi:hypothetical protein
MRRLFLILSVILLVLSSCAAATKVEDYVFEQLRSINEDESESGGLPHKKIGGEEVGKSKKSSKD